MAIHPATAGGGPQITGAIRQASQSTGISFEYLLTTAKMESDFNPTAGASTSSAHGLFQFIDQTWLGTMKQDALAKAETAWRHFTCCVSALSPEQPRRYGKPFMSKRLSIYNLRGTSTFKRCSARRKPSPRLTPQPKASFALWQFARSRDYSVSSWEVSLIGKRSRS